jgi:hypothetical protein
MARHERPKAGPVKAWVEPDRWAYARAFPLRTLLYFVVAVASAVLAWAVHPLFWIATSITLFRQAIADAALRELWREGMLHPARVLADRPGLWATLVRLEGERGVQDAVVVSRIPRGFRGPFADERAAVIITGHPPRLRALSVDLANGDADRARRATERIPSGQWDALSRALSQLKEPLTLGIHPVELGHEPWYGTLSYVEDQGSVPEHVSETNATSWCAGLPLVEEPEMVPRERERVRFLRGQALRQSLLRLAAALLSPVGFILSAGSLREAQHEVWPATVAVMGFMSLLASPLFALSALSALRMARRHAADLAAPRLLRFLGSISSFDSLGLDPDLALLTRKGLFFSEPGAEQDMSVLSSSMQVLHVNGKWAPPGIIVHVERVAPPPAEPFKLPLPEDVHAEGSDGVSVARRRLTELEVDELKRHARVMRRPGRIFWLLTAIGAIALSSWHSQDWVFPPQPVSIIIGILAWLLAALATVRRARLSTRLREDAELGWVVTVDAEHDNADADELPARGVETLLHSHMDWTVNRRPATWRRFAGRTPN